MRDPPSIKLRPEDEYYKSVGERVTFPCSGSGAPAPSISWRRADGQPLPRKRHKQYQGTLTITGLQKKDHGVYECVVSLHNDNCTLVILRNLHFFRSLSQPRLDRLTISFVGSQPILN